MRIARFAVVTALLVVATFPALASAATGASGSTVTMTTPANGALYTAAQPTYSGTASTTAGFAPQVEVSVYSGASASGHPVQTLDTPINLDGTWSVTPSASLADGLYTADATQEDLAAPTEPAVSAPASFQLDLAGATGDLTLASPSDTVITTPTPALSGQAPASPAGTTVSLLVYAGTTTTSSPVRVQTATIAANGAYAFTVSPGLADGEYTAVAEATENGHSAFSAPVTMVIKVNPPATTMLLPAAGDALSRRPTLFGAVGTNPGDLPFVTVTIFSFSGSPLGTASAEVSDGYWLLAWPSTLPLGFYTADATQSDLAGHTTTVAHTFIVVSSPPTIGAVNVAQNGLASVPVVCTGGLGTECRDTVTVVTAHPVSLTAHARRRRVTLFRSRFSTPGATTRIARAQLAGSVERGLRRLHGLSVEVTVSETVGSAARSYRATRRATFAR